MSAALGMPAYAQSLSASYTPFANFTYQLDCVSGVGGSCAGVEDYRALWSKTLLIDPSADPEVARWRQARERIAEKTRGSEGSTFGRDVRVLTLTAQDPTSFGMALAALKAGTEGEALSAAAAALYPRFLPWWQGAPSYSGTTLAQSVIRDLRSEAVRTEVRNVFDIFGQPAAARVDAQCHLMYRPPFVTGQGTTSGENLGAHSIAEFVDGLDQDSAPVLVHEYAHFVFGSLPKAQRQTFKQRLMAAGGDDGIPIWNLFDEAMATALGNGRVRRGRLSDQEWDKFWQRPQSLYASDDIDAAGKAMLGVVDATLARQGTVQDETFARQAAQAMRERVGPLLGGAAPYFKEYSLVMDRDVADSASTGRNMGKAWTQAFETRSRWMSVTDVGDARFGESIRTGLARGGTVAVIVSPAHLDSLLPHLPADLVDWPTLAHQKKLNLDAVLIVRETASPPLLVVLAHDAAAVDTLARMVAAMPRLSAGVWTPH